jgi:hypothetical protein
MRAGRGTGLLVKNIKSEMQVVTITHAEYDTLLAGRNILEPADAVRKMVQL